MFNLEIVNILTPATAWYKSHYILANAQYKCMQYLYNHLYYQPGDYNDLN